jgi:L-ascorbate metabolism protein UlaG (beta-lactamase superfamily)
VTLLPIDDNHPKGPNDALRPMELLTPRLVMAMHCNSFGVIQQDPYAFAERVKGCIEAGCVLPDPGESLSL